LKPARGKDLDATEIMDVRHLLVTAGWSDTGTAPVPPVAAATPDMLVVVDHAGARLYPIHPESQSMAVAQTRHLLHDHIDRKRHDADRDEADPADTRFFEAVAEALPGKGRIVLVSDGKGQSNAGVTKRGGALRPKASRLWDGWGICWRGAGLRALHTAIGRRAIAGSFAWTARSGGRWALRIGRSRGRRRRRPARRMLRT
jgi:hypothetical protein